MTEDKPLSLKESRWTEPVDGMINVPDRLDKLFNRLATQLRFHTISGKGEVETIADMVAIADDHAASQTEALRKELEFEKSVANAQVKINQELAEEFSSLQAEVERLKKVLRQSRGISDYVPIENEHNIKSILSEINKALNP
jgi:Skp family chaperone for outer membrane proteins